MRSCHNGVRRTSTTRANVTKVLFCPFGSAGDLLPSMSVAGMLKERGIEPLFLCDRLSGLYPRAAGFTTAVIGGPGQSRALHDNTILTARFQGLESRRRHMNNYVLPILEMQYPAIVATIADLGPDLIVGSPLGLWGALAAQELGIPCFQLHLYPDLLRLLERDSRSRSWRFSLELALWLEEKEQLLGMIPTSVPIADWGTMGDAIAVVHDPELITDSSVLPLCIGYPYTDQGLGGDPDELRNIQRLLIAAHGPAVVVCLGSFIGLAEVGFWNQLADYFKRSDVTVVCVGVSKESRNLLQSANVAATGYLPMSQIAPYADSVIHHGGIGTMYGVLHAGKPAVVLSRAFDQPYNGAILQDAGAGQHLPHGTVAEACERAVELAMDEGAKRRAIDIGRSLRPFDGVARDIAQRILELA